MEKYIDAFWYISKCFFDVSVKGGVQQCYLNSWGYSFSLFEKRYVCSIFLSVNKPTLNWENYFILFVTFL